MQMVEFKVVGRDETVWINPATIRSLQTRPGGPRRHTIVRYAGLSDELQTVIDCEVRDAVARLTGQALAVPA